MDQTFAIPDGLEPQWVAETMTAYLLGARAFENALGALTVGALQSHGQRPGERRYGPYRQDDKWQLDDTNDFWLRIEDGHGRLTCRYPGQIAVLWAMASLFNCRYPDRARRIAPQAGV